jgi:hypothetical protein
VENGPYRLEVEGTSGLEERILASVGRTVPKRDATDARIVDDVRKGIARDPNAPEDVGGYPALASGTPYPDADQDGMSDGWEGAHALNPADPGDGNGDRDGDGYTNLEEFLNEPAEGAGATPMISGSVTPPRG